MKQIQNNYKVISNEKLCPQFWCMSLDAPELAAEVKPGQFVHFKTSESLEPFFRRPFSVYRAQDGVVKVFYEVVGPGTGLLSDKKSGDVIDTLGPLGTPFRLPGDEVNQLVMVAGGIGIAPFLLLSDILKERTDLEMILLYGGRTSGHVYPMEEFKANGVKVFVATDDGSFGVHGRVTELFEHIHLDSVTTQIYTCGPNPMMAAVQVFAKQHGLKGQAACEEMMACGLGSCLGCTIKTTSGYKTVCYDGPAFELEEILFEG